MFCAAPCSFFLLELDPTGDGEHWLGAFSAGVLGSFEASDVLQTEDGLVMTLMLGFAFIVVIVLLNVLIAVVSDAYAEAYTRAQLVYHHGAHADVGQRLPFKALCSTQFLEFSADFWTRCGPHATERATTTAAAHHLDRRSFLLRHAARVELAVHLELLPPLCRVPDTKHMFNGFMPLRFPIASYLLWNVLLLYVPLGLVDGGGSICLHFALAFQARDDDENTSHSDLCSTQLLEFAAEV